MDIAYDLFGESGRDVEWFQEKKVTETFGRRERRDTEFDDIVRARVKLGPYKIPHISKLDVYYDDKAVYGMQATFYDKFELRDHIGDDGRRAEKLTIDLKPGEYLSNFHGRVDKVITSLTFETSKGRVFTAGSSQAGEKFYSKINEEGGR